MEESIFSRLGGGTTLYFHAIIGGAAFTHTQNDKRHKVIKDMNDGFQIRFTKWVE